MQFKHNPLLTVFISANIASVSLVSGLVIYQKVTSDSAIANRSKGLEVVAQHVKSQTCWYNESDQPFKLGDAIALPGTGRIPTGCIYAPKTEQFLQVAYSGGVLQVVQVYSIQEVKNQLSLLGKNHGSQQ